MEQQGMKAIYIAHPLRDNLEENILRVNEICEQLHQQGEVIPFSPIHAFGFVNPHGCQRLVFEYCRTLLSRSDELWVYGNWQNSEGCRMEIDFAKDKGIPIRFMERSAA